MNIVEKAERYATERHGLIGQVRKYTGEDYINHPAAVVEIVKSVPHTEAMLAAAWLHDVVEDTPTSLLDIRREFGSEITVLVEMLTDVSRPGDGNRKIRKEIDRQHLAKASPEAMTVKLADLIDNSSSIIKYGKGFAYVYLKEKRALLEVLKAGNPVLWLQAKTIVDTHLN